MSVSTLSQQHAYTPNAMVLQIAPPPQNESGRSTQSTTQSGPTGPASSDAGIAWDKLKTPENLRRIAKRLKASFPAHTLTANTRVISDKLDRINVSVQLDASGPPARLPLAQVLTKLGYTLPTNGDEVRAQIRAVEQQAAMMLLGDLGGALSWPIPMSQRDEIRLASFLFSDTTGVPGLPLPRDGKRTLGYLLSGSSVTSSDLRDPPKALEKLLTSPKAMELGRALQTFLGGVDSVTSVYDYLLAAIHIGLDPTSIADQERNTVAGVDLAKPSLWGKPASVSVDELRSKLVADGKATPDTAGLATHMLLAKRAPQYLIKDIPASVPYGSVLWTVLTVAAAKIEAATPGRVPGMTYAEVLKHSESLAVDKTVTQTAMYEAVRDWGVVNGLLPASATPPSAQDINKVVVAFNAQLSELKATSESLQTQIPLRKEMALAKLRKAVPLTDESLYEKKLLKSNMDITTLQGGPWRSMLDIVMEGKQLAHNDHWTSNDSTFDPGVFNRSYESSLSHVPDEFQREFNSAIDKQEKGHKNYVQHLIAKLPLDDRRNLEEGKLEFFHTNAYEIHIGSKDKLIGRAHILIAKTTRKNEVNIYEINTKTGTITKRNGLVRRLTEPYTSQNLNTYKGGNKYATEKVDPSAYQLPDQSAEKPQSDSIPKSYSSTRIEYIGSVFAKALNLGNADVREAAKGSTSYDEHRAYTNAVKEFFLNLIPFRSAIVNFQEGNYAGGLFDLAVDAVGLITMGAGKAAQAGKALKGVTTLNGTAKALRFVGVTAFEAINPVSGVGGLAAGAGKLVVKGGNFLLSKSAQVVNRLRGATNSYDLLKLASKSNGIAAIGTYKLTDQTVEMGAVLKDKKWYALDPTTQCPYGAPLPGFTPNTVAGNGAINGNLRNWLGSYLAPTAETPNLPEVFRGVLDTAKKNNSADYAKGYAAITDANSPPLQAIPGYFPSMKIKDLKELAVDSKRTAEQIGQLAKLIETQKSKSAIEGAMIFGKEIAEAGGTSRTMPQNLYLAQSDLASTGECAALVNTMALATKHGLQNMLMDNFYKASSPIVTPAIAAFRKELSEMHKVMRLSFHGQQQVTRLPFTDIITQLSNATTSTSLRIATQNHGLLAGVIVDANLNKKWYFYDPNFGYATFPDKASMQRGLDKTLNSGKSAGTLDPLDIKNGKPEFDVSTFNDGDFLITVPYNNPFSLFNKPL